jgi:hypothetical protein
MSNKKQRRYSPDHVGKNIIISWDEFWREFVQQVMDGEHEEFLPPTAPTEAIVLAADVYADAMYEWFMDTHWRMSSDGYELEQVRDQLKSHGFNFEEEDN